MLWDETGDENPHPDDMSFPLWNERHRIAAFARRWHANGNPWRPVATAPWELPVLVCTRGLRVCVAARHSITARWFVGPDEKIVPVWWCPLPPRPSHRAPAVRRAADDARRKAHVARQRKQFKRHMKTCQSQEY